MQFQIFLSSEIIFLFLPKPGTKVIYVYGESESKFKVLSLIEI